VFNIIREIELVGRDAVYGRYNSAKMATFMVSIFVSSKPVISPPQYSAAS